MDKEKQYQDPEEKEESGEPVFDFDKEIEEDFEITNEHIAEDEERTKRLKSNILNALMKKKYKELREMTLEMHPADLASVLEDLDENNRLVVFRLLRKDVATEAFTFMSDDVRAELVEGFSDAEIVNTIEEISLDEAADMLEDMPASVVKRVLAKSSRETRESLNKLLHYPEYSAGSIMTPEYVRFRSDMDVAGAMLAIREQGPDAETVYTCYVVDRNKLLGVVTARDLLLSDPDTKISELMDENVITVKVTDDQEYVARQLAKYDFNAMPVVDNEGMLVGIVTIDDAVDVLVDESTEDMQKMAAILPVDQSASYFGTSVFSHAKQRIPWLLILMLSATFTGLVTQHYEASFAAADGHAGQLRQPGLYADGPRTGARRGDGQGYGKGRLEGAPDFAPCRCDPGSRERHKNLPDVRRVREEPGSECFPVYDRCVARSHVRDRAREAGRRGPSSSGKADRSGPGDHGDAVYHHDCGRGLPDHIFLHRGDHFCLGDSSESTLKPDIKGVR